MRNYFFIIGFLCSSFILAQEYTIKGVVKEKQSKEALEAATVYAESVKDSTLISYTISEKDGSFELDLVSSLDRVNLFISYAGYGTTKKLLALKKTPLDLGEVLMEQQMEELEGVSVVAERRPITIKKDTLEYNADSFKARPDANVEELLKKLPGVEVDSDGKIMVNGRQVDKILVDGREFFGSDPKIATKNLPKEIVDKIQFTTTKTETEEFTGKESDSENKTLNITIKKGKNRGYFGRLAAGYGTDDKYQLNGMVNLFQDAERMSIIGGANNVNNTGFSMDGIYDMYGGPMNRVSVGGGSGITNSGNIGTNYSNRFKDKTNVRANYMYSGSSTFNESKTSRENILPDRYYFTESLSKSDSDADTHNADARFAFELDSTLRITMAPRFNITENIAANTSAQKSSDEDGNLINESATENVSENDRKSFNNNINIIKRLDRKGGYVSMGFNNANNINNGLMKLNTFRELYGDNPSQEEVRQLTTRSNRSDGYGINVNYRKPIVEKLFLDTKYNYNSNVQKNKIIVNDYDEITEEYTQFNEELSSDFIFKNIRQHASVGVNYAGKKLSVGIDGNWQNTQMSNDDKLQDVQFDKEFNNFFFSGRFRYQLENNKQVHLNYRSNVRVPNVNQLQPIENRINPTNIRVGNPDLNATVSHNLSLYYNNYDWKKKMGISVNSNLRLANDKIARITITDENLVRTTTYTNLDGDYSIGLGGSFNKQVKKDSVYEIKFNLNLNASYNNNVNFSNGIEFTSKTFNLTPRIGFNYNYKELIDVAPNYALTYSNASYTLENRDKVRFARHSAGVRTTTFWPKNVIWGNDISYSYNGNVSDDFDKSSVFWNMSIGMRVLKDKGLVKLFAYDLLDQNINTSRTAFGDVIQDNQSTVLKQYFLLSFSYKLDQFGGKRSKSGRRNYN